MYLQGPHLQGRDLGGTDLGGTDLGGTKEDFNTQTTPMQQEFAIETRDLCYSFPGSGFVVDHINLQVPRGSIYGFLGPNGAGKTTTMRLLCGMLPGKYDNIYLLGQRLDKSMPGIFTDVGTLIETPSLYLNLTAYDNLKVICALRGLPHDNIKPILETVGLANTLVKTVKAFSLGMKQRLGIAMAMLHQPKLMLLDEPVNGLDPAGIVEIRELLIRLKNEHGITIFISSHLLSEIEKTCDHIGIIHKGKLLFQGSMDSLKGSPGMSKEVQFQVDDAFGVVEKIGTVFPGVKALNANHFQLNISDDTPVSEVNKKLVELNIPVEGIEVKKGLEE
ncbi:MAG TPA: ATP-binding cassette domain-containing protein, partial [Chitinophagaceae bacterium]|nr:ATP-binding cassette domain-containing protein [Chitinophagaceae bacterium]